MPEAFSVAPVVSVRVSSVTSALGRLLLAAVTVKLPLTVNRLPSALPRIVAVPRPTALTASPETTAALVFDELSVTSFTAPLSTASVLTALTVESSETVLSSPISQE